MTIDVEIVIEDTVDKQQSLYSFVIFYKETADTALLYNCSIKKPMQFLALHLLKALNSHILHARGLGGIINIIE